MGRDAFPWPSCQLFPLTKRDYENRDLLVSGNFDRYSAARRTRRYKKAQDSVERETKQEVGATESIEDKPVERPHTLPLLDGARSENSMLYACKDKLNTKESLASYDIDAALADIARSGEDLQRLSRPVSHRNSRLPVSQPSAVIAVTNTVLSPVMQESRPREASLTVFAERAVTSRERQSSMIDPSQVKEAIRLANNPPNEVNHGQRSSSRPRSQNGTRGSASPNLTADPRQTAPGEDEIDMLADPKHCLAKMNGSDDREDKSSESFDRCQVKIQAPCSQTDNSVFRSGFMPPDISVTSCSPLPPSGKARDQEMNDEGFEETQSLVSETLSQETSSGNYETDAHDSTRCSPAELRYAGHDGHPAARGTISVDEADRDTRRSIEGMLKSPPASTTSPSTIRGFGQRASSAKRAAEKSSFLPKRANSLKRDGAARKSESMQRNSDLTFQSINNHSRNEVERSGSRSSLRSSRSSLNSATSVNTVRNLVGNHAHLRTYTSAIRALTNDLRKSPSSSPLPPKNSEKRRMNPRATVTRIPASRSSSSGSSVGPIARNVRRPSGVSNDPEQMSSRFRTSEHASTEWLVYFQSSIDAPKGSKARAATSRSIIGGGGGSGLGQQAAPLNRATVDKLSSIAAKSKLIHPKAGTRNHSFMKPTAASTSKGSASNFPRSIKGLIK